MNKYGNDEFSMHNNDGLRLQIINNNFTEKEISDTIDSLKNYKSPGNDLLPAEFIKACKAELLPLITGALNYNINKRDFPDMWAQGLAVNNSLHMKAVIDLMGDLLKEVWLVITYSYYRDWLKDKWLWASRYTSVW